MLIEWLKVLIMGIVEGSTEFLPISSTGHLIITSRIIQLPAHLNGVFEIFIQIGAVVAVIVYYRHDLTQHVRTIRTDRRVQQFGLGVGLAFVPAAGIGLLFADQINRLLFHPVVVAVALIAGGILFLVVENQLVENGKSTTVIETPLTMRQALIVGLWQVLALIPGMSRSGMSIIGGLMAGLDRQRATQFSFYLAVPTLGGATLYSFLKYIGQIDQIDIELMLLGALVSGIVAWLAIGWLLRYVERNTFVIFGYYRILFGIVILIFSILT